MTPFEALRRTRAEAPVAPTMMQVPLRVTDVMQRAEQVFPDQVVISRLGPDRIVTHTYRDLAGDARQLAGALRSRGVRAGQRVATLMWNHSAHLCAYYAVPGIQAVLHPLNPRLSAEDLAYIVSDAGDAAILIDDDLLPLWREVEKHVQIPLVVVHPLNTQPSEHVRFSDSLWAEFLDSAEPLAQWPEDDIDENIPVSICYTSGTTGRPKGVVYSHRSILLHGLAVATPDALNISGRDTVMTLTPMFHVNAWSMPYTAVMLGARQVLTGPRPSSTEIAKLLSDERVTAALGVPTIWSDVLEVLERNPGRWAFQPGLRIYSGGAAPPVDMFRRFDRQNMHLQTGWGMTEVSPIGSQTWLRPDTDSLTADQRLELRASNGIPLPLVSMRHVDENGHALPWDGVAQGELQVQGPWVAQAYLGHPNPVSATTADGWLRTGDLVTFSPSGYMKLVDRLKDLIKSGGEWISSVDMENVLFEHPDVAEAAVIATTDEKWGERPLAIVALKPGASANAEDIREFLAHRYPKWMVPDQILFTETLPKTGVGKLNKQLLRQQFAPSATGSNQT